jgi:hypothetical protein
VPAWPAFFAGFPWAGNFGRWIPKKALNHHGHNPYKDGKTGRRRDPLSGGLHAACRIRCVRRARGGPPPISLLIGHACGIWHAPCTGLLPITSEELQMKIEESKVVLGASSHFESERRTEFTSRCSFRCALDGASEALDVAQNPPVDKNDKTRLMLEQLISDILALISGQHLARLTDVSDVAAPQGAAPVVSGGGDAPQAREMLWERTVTESIRESERSAFSAQGEIRTADGRAIDFKLDLAMCREFQCERRQVDSGKVVMRDPLVINFDGQAAELDSLRFDFDLDSDGTSESLSRLSGNRGFLAIDRNGDGRINNGSELFGASSGDGFADLAGLNGDGNAWLDEADAAFAALRVWSPGGEGGGGLFSLKEKGVGALYLGSADTPFSLKDDDNRLQGQIRASGLYLNENGKAGSLQQIDLAV